MQKLLRKKAYKAEEPLKTINGIRERLGECDFLTIEHHLFYPVPNVYCCRVLLGDEDIRELELGSNGKGLSPRYSLASAYGEIMERLQNNVIIPSRQLKFASKRYLDSQPWTKDLKERLESEDLVLDYHYAPDEAYLGYNEIVKSSHYVLNMMFGISDEKEQAKYLEQIFKDDKIPSLPYYSVFESSTEYLPYKLIWNMCGTNGMCAGNTPEEGIIQGLSEVFERYVVRSLYFKKLTPPTIPHSYIVNSEITDRIKSLEKEGITLTIKDCSLGKGLPVLGFIFHNHNTNKYAFHVGSDPSPLTALGRCISEFYQGNPQDIERRFNKRNFEIEEAGIRENVELQEAYYATIGGGMGRWPESLYSEKESYQFNGFPHPISESDKSDLKYMLDIFRKLEKKVYIRDVSYLGFPSYHIYVPGMSETDFLFDNEELPNWIEIIRNHNVLLNLGNTSNKELYKLANAIEKTIGLSLPAAFDPSRWFPSNTDKEIKEISRDYLLSKIFFRLEEYGKAAKSLERFINSPKGKSGPLLFYKAELEFLKEKDRNSSMKEIEKKLQEKFGKKITESVIEKLSSLDNAFSDFKIPKCFDCESCKLTDTCVYIPLIKRAKKMQEIQKKSMPNQKDLGSIFSFISGEKNGS